MVDKSTDKMHREWNLTNSDALNVNHNSGPRRSLQLNLFPSESADFNDHSHNNHSHHKHQPRLSSPPTIITTDYSDPSSSFAMRGSQTLFNRHSLDKGYDTDGGIGTSRSTCTNTSPEK